MFKLGLAFGESYRQNKRRIYIDMLYDTITNKPYSLNLKRTYIKPILRNKQII